MFKGFISYTRSDQELVDALREGIIEQFAISGLDCELWDDNQIPLGSEWHTAIQAKLKEVDFVLLFVSNGFLSNKFIVEEEIKVFLERKKEDETFVIIPIAIKPCRYDSFAPLSKYQFFIPDGVKLGLSQKNNITFSHVYNMGSPWVDHYLQLLFDTIHVAISPHINAKKEALEAALAKDEDVLYEFLKAKGLELLEKTISSIHVKHGIPLDSPELEMEAKWLYECILARVVTKDNDVLIEYLAEEKYFKQEVYLSILASFENYFANDESLSPELKTLFAEMIKESALLVAQELNVA